MVRNRRFVNRLIIGHNELRNEGCCCLFRFLCSEEGREYNIQEISLNSNSIGDEGLLAIAEYLRDNKRVRELFLQNVRNQPSVFYLSAEGLCYRTRWREHLEPLLPS